jgi:hypothetical protein
MLAHPPRSMVVCAQEELSHEKEPSIRVPSQVIRASLVLKVSTVPDSPDG